MSDMKVQTGTKFYYPDVMVSCGAFDPESKCETAPVVIIEVLSDSTEAKDRLEKLVAYQALPSLKEYVLVAQDKVKVEIFRREDKEWQIESCAPGDEFRLDSIDFRCPIEVIYEDVAK
jgi:Uma2 family endonuclease